MKLFTIFTFVLSLAVVGYCTPIKRDVNQIKADIAQISVKLIALSNAIVAFPLSTGGTLSAALSIHTNALSLDDTLKTSTTHVISNGPLGETDAAEILNAVSALIPPIGNVLTAIIAKKPAFAALPIGGLISLIYQDLIKLKASTDGFATSLVDNVPISLQSQAIALRTAALSGFDAAIDVFAP